MRTGSATHAARLAGPPAPRQRAARLAASAPQALRRTLALAPAPCRARAAGVCAGCAAPPRSTARRRMGRTWKTSRLLCGRGGSLRRSALRAARPAPRQLSLRILPRTGLP